MARQLAAKGIDYASADNAFIRIGDFTRAQLADALRPDELHQILDGYANVYCPVCEIFAHAYHWSLMQTEYSTDWVFNSEAALKPVYEQLARQAVIAVKVETVSSFPGKKITPSARTGNWQSAVYSIRGHKHQTSHGQRFRQNLR